MKKILLATASFFCVCSAFAGGADQDSDSKVQRIRFEDLKEACLNPARFHNQISPTNIQITCGELRHKWIAEQDGSIPLDTRRIVMTTVVSNKYTASPVASELNSEPQGVPCTQFKQILESVETVLSTTCEQILEFKGTADEYCSMSVDTLRMANPDAVKVQETGKKVNFCSYGKHGKGQDQDQDQDQNQDKKQKH
jgi:hypothetical protein